MRVIDAARRARNLLWCFSRTVRTVHSTEILEFWFTLHRLYILCVCES